jgi:putative Mn2+ efflux pump MntP
MSLFEVLILAIGLAMDCFSVSLCAGAVAPMQSTSYSVRLSSTFGIFHVFAVLIGWAIGGSIASYIERFDHWVVFILLGVVGVNMLRDGFKNEKVCFDNDPSKGKLLLSLAFATSIDGLSIGIGLALVSVNILQTSIIIGAVVFLVALIGVLLGKKLGKTFGNKMLLVGGTILILIGVNVLYQHIVVNPTVLSSL